MANLDATYFQFKKDGDKYYVRDDRIPTINDEINKLKDKDAELGSKITDEKTARENDNKTNNDKIEAVKADLTAETERATGEENNLQTEIDNIKQKDTEQDTTIAGIQTKQDSDETNITNIDNRVKTVETKVADLGAYSIIAIDQQLTLPVDTSKWTADAPWIGVQSGLRSNSIPKDDEVIAAYVSAGNAPNTATEVFLANISDISIPVNNTKYLVMSYYLRIKGTSNPGSTALLPFDLHITVRRKN